MYRTIRKLNRTKSFEFSPAANPIHLAETFLLANGVTRCNYFNVGNVTCQPEFHIKGLRLVQRLAGPFEDFGHCPMTDPVNDETLLVKAIFAKKQFSQAVAIDIHGIDQFQPRSHIQA